MAPLVLDAVANAMLYFDSAVVERLGVDSVVMDFLKYFVPVSLVNYCLVVLIKFLAFVITCFPFLRHASVSPEMTAIIWIFAGAGRVSKPTLTRTRNALNKVDWMYPPLKEVKMEAVPAVGRPKGYFLHITSDPEAGVILWFYGGAFIGGDAPSCAGLLGRMGQVAKCNVYMTAHRKTPEHTIEEIFEDVLEAYTWLCTTTNPGRIIIGGISSGSMLAALLLSELSKRSLPMPAGAFLLSAFLDLTSSTNSMQNSKDPFISKQAIDFVASFGDQMIPDGRRDYWSPLSRSLQGFPPLFMAYSDTESCGDENALYAAKARQEGVAVEEIVIKDSFHAFPLFYGYCPESHWVYCKLVTFIERLFQQSCATKAVTR
eukprot:GGOE01020231.1.p1 GENE.GGOE01020231.1~~GGOE01020231.1.p1  ORF type:complete len:373 (+),score=77.65 GGOE01020231.1:46-1164(+)